MCRERRSRAFAGSFFSKVGVDLYEKKGSCYFAYASTRTRAVIMPTSFPFSSTGVVASLPTSAISGLPLAIKVVSKSRSVKIPIGSPLSVILSRVFCPKFFQEIFGLAHEERKLRELVESGFEFVCDFGNNKIFRKRK